MPFRLTNKAVEDLRSIARYTEKTWGRDQRNAYLSKLDASLHTIAGEPQIGLACDEIRKGYRKLHVGRHLIFYRHADTQIDIIRILHDRMDVVTHLSEKP